MKKNMTSKIIIAVIVFIICIPIFMDIIANLTLSTIKYSDLDNTISTTSSYKFSLVYIASAEDENVKDVKNEIKTIFNENFDSDSGAKAYFMDLESLDKSELGELGLSDNIESAYIFISNGEIIKVLDGKNISDSLLKSYVNEYGINGVSKEVTSYKVAKDAAEYLSLVNKKKTVTMAVFGRNNCFYCNQFLPVYNTVAEENNLDIYYFDSLTYDGREYKKIMNAGLMIPAECSDTGSEVKLEDGFGTPLTLFTKNGKVIDCINGYIPKSELITKLKTLGLIEE